MPLITLKEALSYAVVGQYAIGAFNIESHVSTEAILAAAEERNVPVIINIAEAHYDILDMKHFMPYIHDRVKGSPVPVVINLDHGFSYEGMVQAINYGFSSIMFDGSKYPFEENVRRTKEIVKIAHAAGVSVEAEIGNVGGLEGESLGKANAVDRSAFTVPEEAKRFVEETDIDALAVAVGTIHGIYKGDPDLDYDLLDEIGDIVRVPLVLHGGSGLSDDDFRNAIKHGIRKINFYTGIVQGAHDELNRYLEKANGNVIFADLTFDVKTRMIKDAGRQMDIFGTKPH